MIGALRHGIACNVQAYLKWLGMGCVKCEDANGVGTYSPEVSARSME